MRRYVRERKAVLDLRQRETFVPQSYAWGVEAQVDWYEAVADLGGERVTLQVFVLRSMASGAAFRAYRRATQQAFLDAHEHAFQYFGGVFRRLRYDNLSAAIKRVLPGSRREETARFVASASRRSRMSSMCADGYALIHAAMCVTRSSMFGRRLSATSSTSATRCSGVSSPSATSVGIPSSASAARTAASAGLHFCHGSCSCLRNGLRIDREDSDP